MLGGGYGQQDIKRQKELLLRELLKEQTENSGQHYWPKDNK